MLEELPIILASESPARLELLAKIRIYPTKILPAHINEAELKGELPRQIALRLAKEKAQKVANELDLGVIIAADSVVAVGRSTLPKALNKEDIKYCLQKLSGRRHKVYTGVFIIKKTKEKILRHQKLSETTVKFKRLTEQEIEFYSNLNEGLNKAGGYSIQGYAESFIAMISGSYSNIVGLPLFETRNMLNSLGINRYN